MTENNDNERKKKTITNNYITNNVYNNTININVYCNDDKSRKNKIHKQPQYIGGSDLPNQNLETRKRHEFNREDPEIMFVDENSISHKSIPTQDQSTTNAEKRKAEYIVISDDEYDNSQHKQKKNRKDTTSSVDELKGVTSSNSNVSLRSNMNENTDQKRIPIERDGSILVQNNQHASNPIEAAVSDLHTNDALPQQIHNENLEMNNLEDELGKTFDTSQIHTNEHTVSKERNIQQHQDPFFYISDNYSENSQTRKVDERDVNSSGHTVRSGQNDELNNLTNTITIEHIANENNNVNDTIANATLDTTAIRTPNSVIVREAARDDFIFLLRPGSVTVRSDKIMEAVERKNVTTTIDKNRIVVCTAHPLRDEFVFLMPRTEKCKMCPGDANHLRYVNDMLEKSGNIAEILNNVNHTRATERTTWMNLVLQKFDMPKINKFDTELSEKVYAIAIDPKRSLCEWDCLADVPELRENFIKHLKNTHGFFALCRSTHKVAQSHINYPHLYAITYNDPSDLNAYGNIYVTAIRQHNNKLYRIGHPMPHIRTSVHNRFIKNMYIYVSLSGGDPFKIYMRSITSRGWILANDPEHEYYYECDE
ncbi:hypothetical protein EON71_00900 [bacterium]|nr:MAG: hypothetical protein EON71_00900 [bacterium]